MRLVDVLSVVPIFSANFRNVFKNCCFFGSNLFCDSKTLVTICAFLRSTGFFFFPYFTQIAVVSLSFQEQLINV